MEALQRAAEDRSEDIGKVIRAPISYLQYIVIYIDKREREREREKAEQIVKYALF